MQIYDCHVHTDFSWDAKSSFDEMCNKALALGAKAITATDHDFPAGKNLPDYEHIRQCLAYAKKKNEEMNGSLLVLSGLELSDCFIREESHVPFYEMKELDCILGSIHSSPIMRKYFPDSPKGYDLAKLVDTASEDFLKKFIEIYYTELLKMAEKADFDVLAHITFPFRYINGKANRGFDKKEYYPLIDEILKAVIKTGKALEVNTSGLAQKWQELMPDRHILKRYYDFGGRLVTTGSDAHVAKNLCVGIPEAQKVLKEIGFTHGTYFVKRKPVSYKFD